MKKYYYITLLLILASVWAVFSGALFRERSEFHWLVELQDGGLADVTGVYSNTFAFMFGHQWSIGGDSPEFTLNSQPTRGVPGWSGRMMPIILDRHGGVWYLVVWDRFLLSGEAGIKFQFFEARKGVWAPIFKEAFPRSLAVQNLVWGGASKEPMRRHLRSPDAISDVSFRASATASLWRELDGSDTGAIFLPRVELLRAFYERELASK